MKASQLIAKLQELQKQHGDLDVCCYDKSEGGIEDIDRIQPEYPTLYIEGKLQWGKDDMSQPPFGFVIYT